MRKKPHDRTVQPVVIPQREMRPQQFILGNDETESELSVESRSFFSRVNDQVRKRQKRSSMNVTENDEKTFYDVGNVHVCNIGNHRPPHLNGDRFHQPCLLPGRTSRIGEDCRPRTTLRPLTLLGQPRSSSFASHWRYCHADKTVPRQDVNSPFSPACATPRGERVLAHTQVRDPRESAAACFWPALGTPSPWPSTSNVANMLEESTLNYHIVL